MGRDLSNMPCRLCQTFTLHAYRPATDDYACDPCAVREMVEADEEYGQATPEAADPPRRQGDGLTGGDR